VPNEFYSLEFLSREVSENISNYSQTGSRITIGDYRPAVFQKTAQTISIRRIIPTDVKQSFWYGLIIKRYWGLTASSNH
jgi:hypothetical protein